MPPELFLMNAPAEWALALLAVGLVGLSKGGLGGAFGLMGVPLLSLVLPPVQAAALLLPVLILMDAVGLWTWRGNFDRSVLAVMIPAGLAGIALGWAGAAVTSDAGVKLMVGLVALAFVLRALTARLTGAPRYRPAMGWLWGTLAGFTSFVAHAGGPPFQVHVLPKRLAPAVYTGTSVVFFAVINAVKLGPYAALGMFDARVLASSLVLLPVAGLAVLAGAALVRRMRPEVFYPFTYAMVALVGARLVWDALAG